MDRADESPIGTKQEPRPGWALVQAWVPVELKYLIGYYRTYAKYPSFSYTVRRLLETHPELASYAARLYNDGQRSEPGSRSESDIS